MAAIEQPTIAFEEPRSPPRLDTVDVRMVALMRCVLTLSGLAIIWIDPTEPARYVEVTYGSLIIYCAWSIALFLGAGRASQRLYRYAPCRRAVQPQPAPLGLAVQIGSRWSPSCAQERTLRSNRNLCLNKPKRLC